MFILWPFLSTVLGTLLLWHNNPLTRLMTISIHPYLVGRFILTFTTDTLVLSIISEGFGGVPQCYEK